MNRFAAVLLLGVFAVFGTGALEYAHNLDDMAEDALEDARFAQLNLPASQHPIHDESNCDIHAQLHLAMFFARSAPILILLVGMVAILSLIFTPLVRQHLPARIDCRGPPVVHFAM